MSIKMLNRLLLSLLLAVLTASWAIAQERSDDTNSKSDVRTITGCLTHHGSGDEYLLTGENGSTWEIHNDKSAVNLADHVNQTVTVTGVVSNAMGHNMKEDAKDAAHDAHMGKEKGEHGHLKVTELETVRDSCRQ
ncbi:MAG TPA: hypothetical protein VFO39_14415 [Candidatus Sulfotelmatobacter sp.]|nr:hypothetical protein [Candidatus Sulfotelmatobacter sp.]